MCRSRNFCQRGSNSDQVFFYAPTIFNGRGHCIPSPKLVRTSHTYKKNQKTTTLGCLVQLVMCLTADPGVTNSIPARSHTFAEIDHEIISTAILLPSADSRRVVVSYKQKYVYEVLFNCLEVSLGELTFQT